MSDFRATPKTLQSRSWTSYLVAPTFAKGPAMSDCRSTPKSQQPRPRTAYLPALLVVSAAALGIGYMPNGSAALAAASGTDYSAIATDAVSASDAETVERSIAAYER